MKGVVDLGDGDNLATRILLSKFNENFKNPKAHVALNQKKLIFRL